jgi:hypothetical protein
VQKSQPENVQRIKPPENIDHAGAVVSSGNITENV